MRGIRPRTARLRREVERRVVHVMGQRNAAEAERHATHVVGRQDATESERRVGRVVGHRGATRLSAASPTSHVEQRGATEV